MRTASSLVACFRLVCDLRGSSGRGHQRQRGANPDVLHNLVAQGRQIFAVFGALLDNGLIADLFCTRLDLATLFEWPRRLDAAGVHIAEHTINSSKCEQYRTAAELRSFHAGAITARKGHPTVTESSVNGRLNRSEHHAIPSSPV
jgi:hypothetical protein